MDLQKNGGMALKTQLQGFALFSNDTLKWLGIIAVARIKKKLNSAKQISSFCAASYHELRKGSSNPNIKTKRNGKEIYLQDPFKRKVWQTRSRGYFFNSSSLWIYLMHLLNQAISMGKQMLT